MLRESPAEFQAEFLKLADRAIELIEGNAASYFTRAQIHLALGQREQAIEDLSRGVRKDPDFKVPSVLRPLLQELHDDTSSK